MSTRPADKIKLPYMSKAQNRWYASIRLPKDVQAAFGGKVIVKHFTGLTDPIAAYRAARPVIEGWKCQIAAARGEKPLRELELISEARQKFTRLQVLDNGEDPWETVMHPLLVRLGHVPADMSFDDVVIADHDRDFDLNPVSPAITAVIEQVTGERIAIGTYLPAWTTSLHQLSPKTRDMYVSDAKHLLDVIGFDTDIADVDALSGMVQGWIEAQIRDGLTPKTITRKLGAVRSYWAWLVAHGHVSRKCESPFTGRTIPRPKRKDPATIRQPFTPEQVIQLHHAAQEQGLPALSDLILLAAYTGGRIEELGGLEVSAVNLEADTVLLSSKTDAGHRTVPIMPQIRPVLSRLVAKAQGGQFLFHISGQNKYGVRSAALSKQFGRLKDRLGYDDRLVFHSIRKTVATLFETAQCPEGIAADILGHEKPTMTYGLYSGGSSMAVRREWMVKALVYPESGP